MAHYDLETNKPIDSVTVTNRSVLQIVCRKRGVQKLAKADASVDTSTAGGR